METVRNCFYTETEKKIPISGQTQVLVVGGGPAGFAAAVNAARAGAETILIEQQGDVGGVATTGLMSHWTGRTEGGFYEELLELSRDDDKTRDRDRLRYVINPEKLKNVMLKLLDDAGVELRLYTLACDVVMESNVIKGVITESKSGREAILADVVIDASGDGDIACRAGVPYQKGRKEDGKMQPMTIMFKVGGVDTDRAVFPGSFEETFPVEKGDLQALGREHISFPAGHVLLYRSTLPGIVTCNMTNCLDVDGTDSRDLTRATLTCRRQIEEIVEFLREYVPGFETCFVVSYASMIGVRETRHFQGEQTLTEQDILSARVFEDWVVTKAHFNFDVHNMSGNGLDETGAQRKFPQTKGYTIPYGCLVPRKVEGLLLAGRNISGTHMAHSNYRVMPICVNMGQAAGIAAALCCSHGTTPRRLDYRLIQEKLREAGVSLS